MDCATVFHLFHADGLLIKSGRYWLVLLIAMIGFGNGGGLERSASLEPVLLIPCLPAKEGLNLWYECITLILTWQKKLICHIPVLPSASRSSVLLLRAHPASVDSKTLAPILARSTHPRAFSLEPNKGPPEAQLWILYHLPPNPPPTAAGK